MTDKEVGKLWREHIDHCSPGNDCNEVKLIRKLVEERAWKIAAVYYKGLPTVDEEKTCYKAALRDFGISPEDWK